MWEGEGAVLENSSSSVNAGGWDEEINGCISGGSEVASGVHARDKKGDKDKEQGVNMNCTPSLSAVLQ
jgi:hypothetical protein